MTTNFLEINHDTTKIIDSVKTFLPSVVWECIPYMTVSANFIDVSREIINNDTMLKILIEKFSGELRLYKFPGNSVYRWHKDAVIGCSLNMVLENYHCHTLFSTDFQNGNVFKVEELVYTPNKFYLFNSQILHTVVNLDPRDRILLTLTFNRSVLFEDVKNYLENEYIN